jgi:hypothetical protein
VEPDGQGATPAPVPLEQEPAPAPQRLPRPRGWRATATLVVASLCLAAFAAAAVLMAIPVRTPGVQDCGTPFTYLVSGRVDAVPNAEDEIVGPDGNVIELDPDVAAEARETSCRERVASRAVPAGILVMTATIGGALAFLVELLVVRPRARREIGATAPPALTGPENGVA